MPYNLSIPGFMREHDLQALVSLAVKVPKNGSVIEVGPFMGRSTWALAKSVDPSVKVFTIDCWESNKINVMDFSEMDAFEEGKVYDFNAFKEYVKDCDNVIPIKARSTEAKWPHMKKADLIFIDATHESPEIDNDIAYWLPHLKSTGTISGHDFQPDRYNDVCRAVIRLSEELKLPIRFYNDSTIWSIALRDEHPYDANSFLSSPFLLEQIKQKLY